MPHDGEDYIHRIGRTARAATTGTAYTFISDKEMYKFDRIEKLLGHAVPRQIVPAELGNTPQETQGSTNNAKPVKKNKKKKFW